MVHNSEYWIKDRKKEWKESEEGNETRQNTKEAFIHVFLETRRATIDKHRFFSSLRALPFNAVLVWLMFFLFSILSFFVSMLLEIRFVSKISFTHSWLIIYYYEFSNVRRIWSFKIKIMFRLRAKLYNVIPFIADDGKQTQRMNTRKM